MPTDSTEVGRKLARERRAEIAKHLGELRSVLRDLETHGPGFTATIQQRSDHGEAVEAAKAKIHELDLEYVRLS